MRVRGFGWPRLVQNYKFISWLYVVVVLIVSFQHWLLPFKLVNGGWYTQYNNFVIFKQSFFHLITNQDLYTWYLSEHWDLYKYSPTFSLLFAPLAIVPDIVGLILWNGLNAFLVVLGIRWLPEVDQNAKIKMLLFVLIELSTSLQNAQSNGLVVGILLCAFCLLERKEFFWGIVLIVFTGYIKIFGLVALSLLLFYPNKIKLFSYTVVAILGFFFLPLISISFDQLLFLYKSWGQLLKDDHASSYGLSVMGWLNTWFSLYPSKLMVTGVGLLFFSLPLLNWKWFSQYIFRINYFSSLLVWLVIFNHKAESPTYIIAVTGAIIWYYYSHRKTADQILMAFVFVVTILSPTDIFPNTIQDHYFDPYVIKAIPCIVLWVRIMYDLLSTYFRPPSHLAKST